MNRIKELRIEAGLTQSELAAQLGLNQTAVGKYERDQLEPSISTLKALSSLFECSIDYLLYNTDDFGNITVQGTAPHLSAEETEIVQVYRKLPADLQRRATAYMRNLGALMDEESATKERKTI